MRLKLLVVLMPLMVISAVAVGAVSAPQLTNVSVVGQGNTTTVTLHASGAFTHNEYRPADNLLLVDLIGVSAGKLDGRTKALQIAGVKQYHVVAYSGAGGVQIARLELSLHPSVDVRVNESREGLAVVVTSPESPAATEPKPPAAPEKAAEPAAEKAASPAVPVQVRNVAVARGDDGVQVEVSTSAPVKPQTMTLTSPDRIVLDFPNSEPAGRPRPIVVNGAEVRSVRMGRFQGDPPITRVVIDLTSPQEFDLAENGDKVVVRLRAAQTATVRPAAASNAVASLKPAVSRTPVAAEPAPASVAPAETPVVVAENKPVELPPAPAPAPQVVAVPAAPPVVESEPAAAPNPAPAAQVAALPAAPPVVQSKPAPATPQEFVVLQPKVEVRPETSAPEKPRLMAANNAPVATPAMAEPLHGPAQQAPSPQAKPDQPVNFAAEQRQQSAQTAPPRPRYTGEPISVNLKDADLKDFFRLIHEISGLNIVLDPTISGSLTLVLDDVPWDQALDIVLRNNALDRQLDGNVLRIATIDNLRKEAEARRKQVEAEALAVERITATRFLSYAHSKNILPTLKKMLSSRGEIVSDERTNALIITDIPSVIPAIDNLIAQLDRKTMQVEIEARVVAATRSFARDIGMQLGFGVGGATTSIGGTGAVGKTPTELGYVFPPPYPTIPGVKPPTGDTLTTTPAAIPLFSNLGAKAPTSGLSLVTAGSSYRVDAVLTMAENRGLLKILSRPRVITQSNIQAVVKQGQRIPVVTAAQLGGPPTVQYIEAVLRLTVTPQITVENTIFLNVDIENTTPAPGSIGADNPVLLTQQATTQVLVTNGGTVVIGGVLQSQNSADVNQVPVLGNIPVLGNLFKRRTTNTATQELIFFITPRIVET
ncbi:MAG: type IV pilus secretin PilQ [Terriglobales bacterium]